VPQHEPSKSHTFWIIPNYRSDENAAEIKLLTPAEKMKVALDDSFDPQRHDANDRQSVSHLRCHSRLYEPVAVPDVAREVNA
jgi:hypothetical protein